MSVESLFAELQVVLAAAVLLLLVLFFSETLKTLLKPFYSGLATRLRYLIYGPERVEGKIDKLDEKVSELNELIQENNRALDSNTEQIDVLSEAVYQLGTGNEVDDPNQLNHLLDRDVDADDVFDDD